MPPDPPFAVSETETFLIGLAVGEFESRSNYASDGNGVYGQEFSQLWPPDRFYSYLDDYLWMFIPNFEFIRSRGSFDSWPDDTVWVDESGKRVDREAEGTRYGFAATRPFQIARLDQNGAQTDFSLNPERLSTLDLVVQHCGQAFQLPLHERVFYLIATDPTFSGEWPKLVQLAESGHLGRYVTTDAEQVETIVEALQPITEQHAVEYETGRRFGRVFGLLAIERDELRYLVEWRDPGPTSESTPLGKYVEMIESDEVPPDYEDIVLGRDLPQALELLEESALISGISAIHAQSIIRRLKALRIQVCFEWWNSDSGGMEKKDGRWVKRPEVVEGVWEYNIGEFDWYFEIELATVEQAERWLLMAVGVVLGFLQEPENAFRERDADAVAPRSYVSVPALDTVANVQKELRYAERRMTEDNESTPEFWIRGMLTGVETLVLDLCSDFGLEGGTREFFNAYRFDENLELSRFCRIAEVLHKSFRNPTAHMTTGGFTWNDARFFIAGIRTMLELHKKVKANS